MSDMPKAKKSRSRQPKPAKEQGISLRLGECETK